MVKTTQSWADMAWLNEPDDWSIDPGGLLHATSGDKTDFWQRTHYGFERDDGHALLQKRTEDFSAVLTFSGDYQTLYDQAGLMVRSGPTAWVKFGVELTDGATHLSVVVTDGFSDWSAQAVALDGPVTLRITRLGNVLLMQHGGSDGWQMARLAPLPDAATTVQVGPYLCSPERAGFKACFHDWSLTDPQVKELHE
ncbi:DUF1349 domain-containing protein [Pararhizobium sp. IMCC21322]|uniref:DUF1349 domain-containing protein n=1 Tax=Pararhizobium sp. IMCC21322 TaxID=3067903 RepID=UPI0027426390|nr:DUF1349 domain-containing protein [Pararhizobium sp. IMCC21322]